MNISLVYMVAWMSSRFGWRIKQFAKVGPNNSTLIEYSLSQALPAWFTQIIFIVWNMTEWPFKEMFWDEYKWIPVKYAKQTFNPENRDRPRWTVDALCSAKEYIDGPFVVCNGDDIYWANSFKKLVQHLQNSEDWATIGYKLWKVIPEEWSVNRWIFNTDENNYVQTIEETLNIEKNKLNEFWLTEESLCSMNLFWLSQKSIWLLSDVLEKFQEEHKWDRRIECYLPVELWNFIKSGENKMVLFPTEDQRFGVTNPDDEEIVKKQIEDYEKSLNN